MAKTKAWKWLLIIAVMMFAAYQIGIQQQTYTFPPSYEIEDFPLIAQPDQITCGPTSIAMVLKHYGLTRSVDEVKVKTKTEWFDIDGNKIGGTSPEYIKIAMNHFGVPSTLEKGDLAKLKYYISQNRPPIALVRSGKRTWHYVVVVGYTKNTIITADPGGGVREVLPLDDFMGAWEFSKDLYGRDMSVDCRVCGGDGKIWDNLGPLGVCDTCGGSGKVPDLFWILVAMGDANGYTIIVPKE
ncbi:MAG: C39 family peptidase, partial [Kiloniellales bacterium]|nr:C39 family peptidase [Kiloniellales bacterium]